VNQFTDLTEEEFRSQFLGYRHVPLPQTAAPAASPVRRNKALPDSVDWRDKDVITSVKNQGQCGSCWAFATTEMIESYAALAAGSLPVLSAQQARHRLCIFGYYCSTLVKSKTKFSSSI
jgi:C1A family cysteine protease